MVYSIKHNNTASRIGRKIRELMAGSGYTQKEWAHMLHVSQPSISFYLKGRIPPMDIILKICDILNISIIDLLESTDSLPVSGRVQEAPHDYYLSRRFSELFSALTSSQKQAVIQLMETMTKQESHNEE